MIAQGFGFTRDFLQERNNNAYFRLKKFLVNSKNKRGPVITGEKCGLTPARSHFHRMAYVITGLPDIVVQIPPLGVVPFDQIQLPDAVQFL